MGRVKQIRQIGGEGLSVRHVGMLICLMLLAVVTFVQVAHVHPAVANSAANPDQCPICVVMHSAAPVDVAAPTVVFTSLSIPVPIPVIHSVVRPWHCAMFNRPPPF